MLISADQISEKSRFAKESRRGASPIDDKREAISSIPDRGTVNQRLHDELGCAPMSESIDNQRCRFSISPHLQLDCAHSRRFHETKVKIVPGKITRSFRVLLPSFSAAGAFFRVQFWAMRGLVFVLLLCPVLGFAFEQWT